VITVGNREMPWTAGMTVADVLERLGTTGVAFLVDVDGKILWEKDWKLTVLPDGARMRVHPMMGGG
jgi:thiamine biosynthesis protein ThiS